MSMTAPKISKASPRKRREHVLAKEPNCDKCKSTSTSDCIQQDCVWEVRGKPIYYAHSLQTYHTQKEADDISAILMYGIEHKLPYGDIVNPNGMFPTADAWIAWLSKAPMKKFQAVFFAKYKGHIGRGQFEELRQAILYKVPIYEILDDQEVQRIIRPKMHIVDITDWKVHYGDIHGIASTKRRTGNKA